MTSAMSGCRAGALFRWIDRPRTDRALHFAAASWKWEAHTYADVGRQACVVANGLVREGLQRNDVVLIVASHGTRFVAALYGAMLSGATPAVLAPPLAFQNEAAYNAHLLHVIRTATPRVILASAELVSPLSAIPGLHVPVCAVDDLPIAGAADGVAPSVPLADLALLQFTAGSSGEARGVRVPYQALHANVAAIRRWLAWSDEDTAAFWAPHYHDMGLIGGLIAPLASQCDLWLLTPEQFVRRPLEYLRCFGERGARLTALPPFGLDYIVRRIKEADLHGMDFSAVKGIVIGAELVDRATLVRFQDLLAPVGLLHDALLPAYGLAEATLAVSGVPLGGMWSARPAAGSDCPVVGCGFPLSGLDVAIVDEHGRVAPEGEIGEIVIRGPSVASGYHASHPSGSLTAFEDATLHSGDAGFQAGGELFPVGRLGDSIKIRGCAVFAERLETELHQLGHRREHNTVVLGMRDGHPVALWIAEQAEAASQEEALQLLVRLAEGADVTLVRVSKGTIPRTSSGKPRRRVLWRDYVRDLIPAKAFVQIDRQARGAHGS